MYSQPLWDTGTAGALQEQSQSMSVRLRNRKAAEAKLGSFLSSLALPPALIDGILLAAPNEGFAVGCARSGLACEGSMPCEH